MIYYQMLQTIDGDLNSFSPCALCPSYSCCVSLRHSSRFSSEENVWVCGDFKISALLFYGLRPAHPSFSLQLGSSLSATLYYKSEYIFSVKELLCETIKTLNI